MPRRQLHQSTSGAWDSDAGTGTHWGAWPSLNAYNDFILAWHSSGFDKFWEWKIAADYMNAHRQNRIVASQRPNLDIGPVQLGIDNFIGLILLWCFGMICSLLTFAIELWKGQEQSVL